MKKDPESTVKGGIFSLRADMLKERRAVSRASASAGYWRAAAGGESPHARLRVASEAGEVWARWKGDPSSQPFLFSPSSGPGLLCWLPPQWLCPGHWHGDWQVKLMGIWGGLLCAPQELSLDHLPLPSLLPQSLQRMIIRYQLFTRP